MKRYAAALAAVLAVIFGASGQQRRVIAGLEGDETYRALISEEGALVRTADSLTREVGALRRALATDTENAAGLDRAAASAAIVGLEERSFGVRSRMAEIASRINAIEQEWVLSNMRGEGESAPQGTGDGTTGGQDPVATGAAGGETAGEFFRRNLTSEQLAELAEAERAEREVPALLELRRAYHDVLRDIAREHDEADTQAAVDSLRTAFLDQAKANARADEEAGALWERAFDSKSYIYSLVAEKMNYADVSREWAEALSAAGGELARVRAASASEVAADYAVQKPLLLGFEAALAERRGNAAAADSLRRAARAVASPAEGLAPVRLRERLLLDWADVTVGKTPYSSANPIPELKVWPRGVIYRVRLGTFSARQSVGVFRGASPLAVERGEDGKYRYYAGGFRTDSLAEAAVEQLRKAGFRAPTAVVWMDGTPIDPAAEDEGRYRVEIAGVEELPDEVRALVGGAGIVRGAEGFVATPLDGAAAMRLRAGLEALKATHPGLEARLVRNPE